MNIKGKKDAVRVTVRVMPEINNKLLKMVYEQSIKTGKKVTLTELVERGVILVEKELEKSQN